MFRKLILLLLAPLWLAAEDWPQFRGPHHDGISREKNWLTDWPEEGPKRLWEAQVGIGFSSVAVSNGRVYTLGHANGKDVLHCLDAGTGRALWKHEWASDLGAKFYIGGPGSTPTVHGGRIYVAGKWGEVICLSVNDGQVDVVWTRHLAKKEKVRVPTWGFNGSPLVLGDRLLLNAGAAGVALDLKTGKTLWKSAEGEAGYATPLPVQLGGQPHVIVSSGRAYAAVRVADGREAWSLRWFTRYGVNAADAIVDGDQVFVGSGYRKGCGLYKIGAELTEIWKNKNLSTQMNAAVKLGDYLYGFDGDSGGPGKLRCVSWKTGEVVWEQATGFGALSVAAGRLLVLTGAGALMTAPATPKGFTPTGRARVLDKDCWTAPVLANGLLYCRNSKGHLVCLDLRRGQ